MDPSVWANFFGLLSGAAITLLVSRYFYDKATKDLKKETDKLVNCSTQIAKFLEWTSQEGNEARFTEEDGELRLVIKIKKWADYKNSQKMWK